MTAATAILVGLFSGFKFGMVRKAFRVTIIAIAIVLVFQTIMLATVDRGRAFEGDGVWSYWIIQLVIFVAGAGMTWLGAKLRIRRSAG
jgi:hypothetical protein